jgi:hypothetical protein
LPLLSLGLSDSEDERLAELLEEIYQAVHAGQLRIAAMGIRALLEQMMTAKVGDQGSFQKNLDVFHQQGWVSLIERDAISTILDAGHAVTHRFFKPSTKDLNTALDITEGVFAAIYVHQSAAEGLAKRVPVRPVPKSRGPGKI